MTKNGLEDDGRVFQADIEPQVIEFEKQTKRKGKSTGPRTARGKRQSSRNALKKGLFSKVVLLESESRPEYRALWVGFQEHFKPVGIPESLLVEKLATLAWRQRRLLDAESVEISRRMASVQTDTIKALEIQRLDYAAPDIEAVPGGLGVDTMRELRLIRTAIGRLTKYLRCAEADQPGNEEELERIRDIVFGAEKGNEDRDTREVLEISRIVAKFAAAKGCHDPEKASENFREALRAEIEGLEKLETGILALEMLRAKTKSKGALVLPERISDQFVRVEAHFSREFDRTLSQLERLQRIRKGQPVLPALRVEVDS